MKIEITKKVEVVNDVPKPEIYTVYIERKYGSKESIEWNRTDWLVDFDLEDIIELAQKLSDRFLTAHTN